MRRTELTQPTLRARVAMLAAVAVGASVALAAAAAYLTLRHELTRQIDTSLLARAEGAANGPLTDPRVMSGIPAAALGAADVRIALVRADGVTIVALGESVVPVGRAEFAVAAGARRRSLRTTVVGETSYRVVAVPTGGGALVIARSLAESDRVLGTLTIVLLTVGFVGIVVAGSAGLAVARTGLAPVKRLTAAAEHIARTEELAPIEVTRPGDKPDEISRLALAFNAMLAALADSRDRQRRLVADASHELRTPLTSLRTNLDLLAQAEAGRGLPAEDRRQLLADVRAQVAELSGLVTDLVELAREDAAPGPLADVDLVEVTEHAVDRARRRAGPVRFAVSLEPWHVSGDVRLLERAVTNLLDNAAKWSPPTGTVSVVLRDGVLKVTDEGPGIPEADRPHIFERFYRAPGARPMPGSGLGLAIVRQVAEQHGGSVEATSAYGGGALLTLTLPGTPYPHPTLGSDSATSQPTRTG